MLGEIDKSKKPLESRLFLCKPNRETIAELPEAFQKNISYNSNSIHELTFQLPFKINQDHKFIRNAHVDMLRGHFLIRYEKGNEKLWFVIDKPRNVSDDEGKESKQVNCHLLPYQLNKKIIRSYSATKKLYDSVGSDGLLNETLLVKTDWSVGYIDADIALKYRTFDISEKSLLEFITSDIADAFDCIIQWDTVNKQVSFYKEENLGTDKGLSIEEGKYLKSIEQDPDFDSVVTRLYVYGKDNLTIQRQNPSGSPYIESFDYYMYPFERDTSVIVSYEDRDGDGTAEAPLYKVVKSSHYMSDNLCQAILDYNDLLVTKQGEFDTLLSNKTSKQETLATKENELFTLNNDMAIILDNIDIANATGQDTTQLITDKNNKQVEIDTKKSEISQVKTDIAAIDTDIATLRNEIAKENNFTTSEILELEDNFVHERIYTNSFIDDDVELYDQGIKELNKVKQPLIRYSISSVDFLRVVECQRDWEKLKQFDIVTIKYPNFGIEIKAKLISIQYDEDSNDLSLEIANAKDIQSGFMTLKDLLQQSASSSTTLDMSKFKWDKSESNSNEINQILNNAWDATKREIEAGVNESVDISKRGIIIKDPNDPLKMLIAQHGTLALSSDGGNTWKTAIKPSGVYAETLIGQIIAGQNLTIVNESGKYTMDANGFTIEGGSLTITDGLPKSQIDPTAVSTWDNSVQKDTVYNGVTINSANGVVVNSKDGFGNDKNKTILNATDGIKIQKYDSASATWKDKFYANTDGSLVAEELITKKIVINDGADKVLVDASTATINFDNFTTKVGQLTADNIHVNNMIEAINDDSYTRIGAGRIQVGNQSLKTGLPSLSNSVTKVRYIRDWLNGSTSNTGNHWVEIKAMSGKTNVALGKPVTTQATSTPQENTYVTDGNTDSSLYYGVTGSPAYVQVDLGSIREDIDYLQIWHYHGDGRTYYDTKTEVSEDGVTWIPLFDSSVTSTYKETSNGLLVPVNSSSIRSLNSRMSIAEDDITLRVEKTTYETDINDSTNGLKVRMTSAEQKITDDAIVSTVRSSTGYANDLGTKTDQTDFNNLAIGGSNLLKRTDFSNSAYYADWKAWNSNSRQNSKKVTLTSAEQIDFLRIESVGGLAANTNFGLVSDNTFSMIAGKEYTISFLVAAHSNAYDDLRYTYLINSANSNQKISTTSITTHKIYGKFDTNDYSLDCYQYSITFTPTYTDPSVKILIGSATAKDFTGTTSYGLIYTSRIKIEEGNRRTAWTPLTTDTESRLVTAESTITQQAGEISLRVEKDKVISQINQTAEAITIDAKLIHLSGTSKIDNAVIKDAMIDSMSVSKLTAGSLAVHASQVALGTDFRGSNVKNLHTPTSGLSFSVSHNASGDYLILSQSESTNKYIWGNRFPVSPAQKITVSYEFLSDSNVSDTVKGRVWVLASKTELSASNKTSTQYDYTYNSSSSTASSSWVKVTDTFTLASDIRSAVLRLDHYGSKDGLTARVRYRNVMVNYGDIAVNWQAHPEEDLTVGSITADKIVSVRGGSDTSYAVMDSSGFYTKNGAMTIERPDGYKIVNNGMSAYDVNIQSADPPFTSGSIAISGYFWKTTSTTLLDCNFYTFEHKARYLNVDIYYYVASGGTCTVSIEQGSSGEGNLVVLGSASTTSTSISNRTTITIDLGVPDGSIKSFFIRLKTSDGSFPAYARTVRRWVEL